MTTNMQVKNGKANLAVSMTGEGRPVVFLHANVCDSRMWDAQVAAVSSTHKAITYDRRGFGKTTYEAEPFSPIADLMAVVEATAGGGPVILVGCSQGGKIAIDAALSYPEKIHALVLIAPSVGGAPQAEYTPEIKRLMAAQKDAEDAGDIDRVNAIKAHLWLDGPLARAGRVSGPARDLFLEMNGIALRAPGAGPVLDTSQVFDRLWELSAHTLVICGEQDFPHILERCRDIAAVVPNAVGVELKEAAHLPSLDSPEEIILLIEDFLRSY